MPPLPLRCARCIVSSGVAGITGRRQQVIDPSISAAPGAIWPGCTTIPVAATRACAGATADSAGSNSRILRAATSCRPVLIHTRCRAIIPLFTRMKSRPQAGRLNIPEWMTRAASFAGLIRIHPPVLALTARKGAGTNRHRNPNRRAPSSRPLRRRPRRNRPRRPSNHLPRSSPPKRLNPSPPHNRPKPEVGVVADGVGGCCSGGDGAGRRWRRNRAFCLGRDRFRWPAAGGDGRRNSGRQRCRTGGDDNGGVDPSRAHADLGAATTCLDATTASNSHTLAYGHATTASNSRTLVGNGYAAANSGTSYRYHK